MTFSCEYRVQFRDTDAAGVVYFANIISICHVAYEASLIESGIDLKSFVNNPEVAIPIIHVSGDFFRPLFCGDRLKINLTPQLIDSYRLEINYQILAPESDEDNLLIYANLLTKHIAIDPQTRKRKELPESIAHWLAMWG